MTATGHPISQAHPKTERGSARAAFALAMLAVVTVSPATGSQCDHFEPIEGGEVAGVIDARTVRLRDGRSIRLAGLAPLPEGEGFEQTGRDLLGVLADGKEIMLHADNAAGLEEPDRYGRTHALAFVVGAEEPLQAQLLASGGGLAAADLPKPACNAELVAAEARARAAARGIWTVPGILKNAQSAGDLLASLGQFAIVHGTVVSVRQSGATIYLNFGRRWTHDFAVTMPSKLAPALGTAKIPVMALANKRLRVRGWLQRRTGLRMEVTRADQIELLAD